MRYCLALDLKNDPHLISEYKRYHERIWPEITKSIKESGIEHMEIYHVEDRLFMMVETTNDFSFERKNDLDANNPKVREWEELMNNYQKKLPNTPDNEKWVLMEKIFDLKENG